MHSYDNWLFVHYQENKRDLPASSSWPGMGGFEFPTRSLAKREHASGRRVHGAGRQIFTQAGSRPVAHPIDAHGALDVLRRPPP